MWHVLKTLFYNDIVLRKTILKKIRQKLEPRLGIFKAVWLKLPLWLIILMSYVWHNPIWDHVRINFVRC